MFAPLIIFKNKKGLICAIVLIMQCLANSAQEGYSYIENYQITGLSIDNEFFSSLQANSGELFFANRYGVVVYDGVRWSLIDTKSTPYALFQNDDDETVYVGCGNQFGYIARDAKSRIYYKKVSDSVVVVEKITDIGMLNDSILFYSNKALYIYDISTKQIEIIEAKKNQSFGGFFILKDKAYIVKSGRGLYYLNNEGILLPVIREGIIKQDMALGFTVLNNKKVFFAVNNSILEFDGRVVKDFITNYDNYFNTNSISDLKQYDKDKLMVSTLTGGFVIIDSESGKMVDMANYQSGLPDDEIQTICKDKNGGVWVAHEFGVSRVDHRLPIQKIGYPGLEGNIYSTLFFNNTLYVATSEGVYYLTTVKNYNEIRSYIRKEYRQNAFVKRIPYTKNIQRLINVSFYVQDTNGMASTDSVVLEKEIPISIKVPVDSFKIYKTEVFSSEEDREVYGLKSIPYIFKEVTGIRSKVTQIIDHKGKLIAAGNNGLYEIIDNSGMPVLEDIYVNFVNEDQNNLFVAHSEGVVAMSVNEEGEWEEKSRIQLKDPAYSLEYKDGVLWVGSNNNIIKIPYENSSFKEGIKSISLHNKFKDEIIISQLDNSIVFYSQRGIFSYKNDSIIKYSNDIIPHSHIINNHEHSSWIKGENKYNRIKGVNRGDTSHHVFLNLFNLVADINVDKSGNLWVVSNNEIYRISVSDNHDVFTKFNISINQIKDKSGNFVSKDYVSVNFSNNALTFELSPHYYLSEDKIRYKFYLEGLNDTWTEWHTEPKIHLSYLPSGQYKLHIMAENALKKHSSITVCELRVKPPIWRTWWFVVLMLANLALLIYLFIKFRVKRLERANRILQSKIDDATKEIRSQKEELQVAYEDIEKKNQNITSSIVYAERIQSSMLPMEQSIKEAFAEYFILFKPRDIVSGDFYWFFEDESYKIIIAADCTGHGVPGAFMSMIGNSLLNKIIREHKCFDPAEILIRLDTDIVKALKQDTGKEKNTDGMDIAICTLPKSTNEMWFAGAHNPLYKVAAKDNELTVIDADRYSIGGIMRTAVEKTFETKKLALQEGDVFYIFSDGYIDQAGGKKGKKLNSYNFQQLIKRICVNSLSEQKNLLVSELDKWKGNYPQRDDIIIIGFKI